jgi:hypothetical protein
MKVHISDTARPALLAALLVTLSFTLAAPALAQKAAQAGGPPPLLDRELFLGNPEIAGAQISPDGQFIAFIKPYKETRNIWVKRADEPFDKARLVTNDTKRPIPSYFWSRDAKYILFTQDKGGDENYNVYAVNPAETPAAGQEVPAARNLTDAKGARAFIYDVPKNDPDTIFVGLNDRDPAWHDVYKVKISTGERTLVKKNTERISGWTFDLAGKLRLASRVADNGDTEILRVDEGGFTKVYSCGVFETCGPARFHKDNSRVYFITNKGDADLIRLTLFDPATGKEELVESDPLNRVDFTTLSYSVATDELIATVYEEQGLGGGLQAPQAEARRQGDQRRLGDERRAPRHHLGVERHRAGRDVPFRPADEEAHPPIPHPREAAARAPRADEGHPLQVVGRPRNSRLPDAAEGRRGEEPAARRQPARRPVGARLVGL